MSGRSSGLAALARWRSFQEARAATARQLAQQAALSAAEQTRQAQEQATALGLHRLALQQRPLLDLARVAACSAMEQAAWGEVAQCAEHQQQKDSAAAQARAQHEGAHRNAEAVAQRVDRVRSAEQREAEMRAFETLAQLRPLQRRAVDD